MRLRGGWIRLRECLRRGSSGVIRAGTRGMGKETREMREVTMEKSQRSRVNSISRPVPPRLNSPSRPLPTVSPVPRPTPHCSPHSLATPYPTNSSSSSLSWTPVPTCTSTIRTRSVAGPSSPPRNRRSSSRTKCVCS